MGPLVSVIIPTFNRVNLIFRALESVTQQTYKNVEVIVVDDCSTDGTPAALLGTNFPFPLAVEVLGKNQGPAAARNAGILKANGKYIAFLDSDDTWLPNKLSCQVSKLENISNNDKHVLYSQVWIRRQYETILRPQRAKNTGESIADYVFANGGYLDQNTIILSSELAKKTLYRTDMRLHEDWDFYMRLEEQGVAFTMVESPLGITYAMGSTNRASASKPKLSLEILESWKPKISTRAYWGLRARIAPQLRAEDPLYALRIIFAAYKNGAINKSYAIGLLGNLVHPSLRDLAHYIRGKLSRSSINGKTLG